MCDLSLSCLAGFAWFIFLGSTAAAIIGGVVDWQLPYAAWLADPTVQPRTFVYSYIGMAVATVRDARVSSS